MHVFVFISENMWFLQFLLSYSTFINWERLPLCLHFCIILHNGGQVTLKILHSIQRHCYNSENYTVLLYLLKETIHFGFFAGIFGEAVSQLNGISSLCNRDKKRDTSDMTSERHDGTYETPLSRHHCIPIIVGHEDQELQH